MKKYSKQIFIYASPLIALIVLATFVLEIDLGDRIPAKLTNVVGSLSEYSNPFYRFLYPSSYQIVKESVQTEHKEAGQLNTKVDVFGLTLLRLLRTTDGSVRRIIIQSTPNWGLYSHPREVIEEEKANFLRESVATQSDRFEKCAGSFQHCLTMIRAVDASDETIGMTKTVIATERYVYEISMTWTDVQGNHPTSHAQQEFQTVTNSFVILD